MVGVEHHTYLLVVQLDEDRPLVKQAFLVLLMAVAAADVVIEGVVALVQPV
jgi:hypothetical protein